MKLHMPTISVYTVAHCPSAVQVHQRIDVDSQLVCYLDITQAQA